MSTPTLDEKLKQAVTDVLQIYTELVVVNREKYTATGVDRYLEILNEALTQIHAAYKEAGYVEPYVGADTFPINPRYTEEQLRAISEELSKPRMTGQEWYDRYEHEKWEGSLDNLKDMPHSTDYAKGIDHAVLKCDEAAKRASGVDHE